MTTIKIPMNFHSNVRPIDTYMDGEIIPSSFNRRAPPAKYYRKTTECCNSSSKENINQVFKFVQCCTTKPKYSANTAFPVDLTTGKRPDYFSSMAQYRKNRGATFDQKNTMYQYNSTTNEVTTNTCSDSTSSKVCNKAYYKPRNAGFDTNGAVDASTRLVKLKYNTITTSAKYNQHHRLYRGDTSQNTHNDLIYHDTPCVRYRRNGNLTSCNKTFFLQGMKFV